MSGTTGGRQSTVQPAAHLTPLDRDARFKVFLRRHLGETGLYLLVCQATLFLFAMVMLVAVAVGMMGSRATATYPRECQQHRKPALLLPDVAAG